MKRNSTDWVDIFLQYNIDVPGRTIFLNGSVEPTTLDTVLSGLHLIGHDKDVLILINSPGGNLGDGLGIYDALVNHGGHVTGRVVGEACSAACILLQACDTREATKHSTIMHHVGSAEVEGHARNVHLFSDFYKKQLDMVDDIMVARIQQVPGKAITKQTWRNRNAWDTYLTAEEAKEVGLIDTIVGEI
jgi:ATP-dependent Clp protease, protease subunit